MAKQSAGLLMFRRLPGRPLEVLLAHPGGPFWAKKDLGAWTIPKGEYTDEDPLVAAQREFQEETGCMPAGPFIELATIRQKSGKVVSAWAFEADWDPCGLRSNDFELEWPKGSGKMQAFPEVERAEWFTIEEARRRMLPAQVPLLDRLVAWLDGNSSG
ncbi:MAG: NUDIX domain-containing protein [Vicinamibacterales bacterium]